MFAFGRRKIVQERAKTLASLMVELTHRVYLSSFDDFVIYARRRRFVESYIDSTQRIYGFFETPPPKADFSFHADYSTNVPMIVAEGHHDYFGLVLSALSPDSGIGVDMKPAASNYGRDAKALQSSLLKFRGFSSIDQITARLLGNFD